MKRYEKMTKEGIMDAFLHLKVKDDGTHMWGSKEIDYVIEQVASYLTQDVEATENRKKIILREEDPIFKDIWDTWKKQAGSVKNPEELRDFADHLMNDYVHDYGTCVRAIACLALAGAHYGAKEQGITGFQAGCVMWDFIRGWMFENNECGMRLLNYDDLLYPQCANKFNTISEETWELVQEKAKEYLEIKHGANDEVRKHWESIVDGKIPAGLKIDEE